MGELIGPVRELFGGGTLTPWLVLGGVVLFWLALKAVRTVVKIALLALGGTLLGGVAPWSGAALDTPAAVCATAAVADELRGWPSFLAKRITAEELSPDARCDDDGRGLAAGTGGVKVRSFFDVPYQTWAVDPDGPRPITDLPTA